MAANEQSPGDNQRVIQYFKGLNERARYVNRDITEFDQLFGFVQERIGTIQRPHGIKLLQYIPDTRILTIAQTFDTRQNVIVQTDNGVAIYSEAELFNRASTAVLAPVVLPEEETMSRALIYHTEATGVNGGTIAAGNTWTTRPLNQIIEQVNPDGTAATFVTALAGNTFTLAAGTYRVRAMCLGCDNSGSSFLKARLFNVNTLLPAWNGAQNEESTTARAADGFNTMMLIQGSFTIGVPTQFRIEQWSSTATDTSGFGRATGTGKPEVYAQVEILKTA